MKFLLYLAHFKSELEHSAACVRITLINIQMKHYIKVQVFFATRIRDPLAKTNTLHDPKTNTRAHQTGAACFMNFLIKIRCIVA